jgi:hypothetical protein
MKKISIVSLTLLVLIIGLSTGSWGQTTGDFRSVSTGIWTNLSTWEYFDGSVWVTPSGTEPQGYPGQFNGTETVVIRSGHVVTITSAGISTQPMTMVVIENDAQLTLTGTTNNSITFYLNTLIVNVIPQTGKLHFVNKVVLSLPANAVIYVSPGGLTGSCNNNVSIYIGGQLFANCAGAPGSLITFGALMAGGGSLSALPDSDAPKCEGNDVNLTGSFAGAFGTTTSGGSTYGVNYSWYITGPGGYEATASTQNTTIPSNAIPGTYFAELTVSTYLSGQLYANYTEIEVIISPETVGGSVTGEPMICIGNSTLLTLEGNTGDAVMWQFSTDGISWTDIMQSINTYETFALTTSTQFRAVVQSGPCDPLNSTTITIDIWDNGNWFGKSSTDWNDEENWCYGIPTLTTDVVISNEASFKPVIGNGNGTCKDLTIADEASVTINAGFALTVAGILTNSAGSNGLVLKSDASGTGSLIHVTPDVEARVERYLTPNLWHYTSVPVSDALSGVFLDIYLRTFDEPTYSWNPWIVPTDIPLEVMLGYAAWVSGDPMTVTFEGKLNTGNHSINVTRNNSLTNPGWNLVGNPYPSALNWDAASGWNKTNVNNTIYYYSGNGGLSNYKYYIGSGGEIPGVGVNEGTNEIPAMQGFFVHASADGPLSVNNNARIHSTQPYYKNSYAEIPVIRLHAEGNGLNDETVIRFYAGADLNFDGDFDALKLFGNGHPQIYSVTADQTELSISTLPGYNEETIIPIGFMSATEGLHTISLNEFTGFGSSAKIFLKDLVTGSIQQLSEEVPYTFSSAPGDETNRFLLHFSNPLGISANTITASSIYSHGNTVYINLLESSNAEIFIHDLLGREIYQHKVSGENLVRIDLASETGFYLVTVHSGNQKATQKVIIR